MLLLWKKNPWKLWFILNDMVLCIEVSKGKHSQKEAFWLRLVENDHILMHLDHLSTNNLASKWTLRNIRIKKRKEMHDTTPRLFCSPDKSFRSSKWWMWSYCIFSQDFIHMQSYLWYLSFAKNKQNIAHQSDTLKPYLPV